jgi:diadenylate cyclase
MIFEYITNAFSKFTIFDLIDILFLFLLFYYLIIIIKGTKTYLVIIGLISVGVIAFIANLLKLNAFSHLINKFLTYIIIAIIVLFQDELKQIFSEIGRRLNKQYNISTKSKIMDEIINAIFALSLSKIGAIITIEKEIKIEDYVNKPVIINATVSKDLLLTIFTPNSPLHDGAVIIKDDRIVMARCFFPLPPLLEISPTGTRHLAAIGISQQTDSVTIVVSEETGKISLAAEGELIRGLDKEGLRRRLLHFKVLK